MNVSPSDKALEGMFETVDVSPTPSDNTGVSEAMIAAARKADDRAWDICDNGLRAIYLAMSAAKGVDVDAIERAIERQAELFGDVGLRVTEAAKDFARAVGVALAGSVAI